MGIGVGRGMEECKMMHVCWTHCWRGWPDLALKCCKARARARKTRDTWIKCAMKMYRGEINGLLRVTGCQRPGRKCPLASCSARVEVGKGGWVRIACVGAKGNIQSYWR